MEADRIHCFREAYRTFGPLMDGGVHSSKEQEVHDTVQIWKDILESPEGKEYRMSSPFWYLQMLLESPQVLFLGDTKNPDVARSLRTYVVLLDSHLYGKTDGEGEAATLAMLLGTDYFRHYQAGSSYFTTLLPFVLYEACEKLYRSAAAREALVRKCRWRLLEKWDQVVEDHDQVLILDDWRQARLDTLKLIKAAQDEEQQTSDIGQLDLGNQDDLNVNPNDILAIGAAVSGKTLKDLMVNSRTAAVRSGIQVPEDFLDRPLDEIWLHGKYLEDAEFQAKWKERFDKAYYLSSFGTRRLSEVFAVLFERFGFPMTPRLASSIERLDDISIIRYCQDDFETARSARFKKLVDGKADKTGEAARPHTEVESSSSPASGRAAEDEQSLMSRAISLNSQFSVIERNNPEGRNRDLLDASTPLAGPDVFSLLHDPTKDVALGHNSSSDFADAKVRALARTRSEHMSRDVDEKTARMLEQRRINARVCMAYLQDAYTVEFAADSFSLSLNVDYIPNPVLRLAIYNKVFDESRFTSSAAGIHSIAQLMRSEFGPLPPTACSCLNYGLLRIMCRQLGITRVMVAADTLLVYPRIQELELFAKQDREQHDWKDRHMAAAVVDDAAEDGTGADTDNDQPQEEEDEVEYEDVDELEEADVGEDDDGVSRDAADDDTGLEDDFESDAGEVDVDDDVGQAEEDGSDDREVDSEEEVADHKKPQQKGPAAADAKGTKKKGVVGPVAAPSVDFDMTQTVVNEDDLTGWNGIKGNRDPAVPMRRNVKRRAADTEAFLPAEKRKEFRAFQSRIVRKPLMIGSQVLVRTRLSASDVADPIYPIGQQLIALAGLSMNNDGPADVGLNPYDQVALLSDRALTAIDVTFSKDLRAPPLNRVATVLFPEDDPEPEEGPTVREWTYPDDIGGAEAEKQAVSKYRAAVRRNATLFRARHRMFSFDWDESAGAFRQQVAFENVEEAIQHVHALLARLCDMNGLSIEPLYTPDKGCLPEHPVYPDDEQ
jgi:hypothetical protein